MVSKEQRKAEARAYYLKHKEKILERTRQYYQDHKKECKDRMRSRKLKHYYGLTIEEYQQKVQEQKGCCAICGGTSDKNLDVDHSHVTGAVRGLLCNNCNRGIGHLQDDPKIIQKAVAYLQYYL